jgi:hypothetical protein
VKQKFQIALAISVFVPGLASAACPVGSTTSASTFSGGTLVDSQQGIKLTAMSAQTFKAPSAPGNCIQLVGLSLSIRKDGTGGGTHGDVIATVFNTNGLGEPTTAIANAAATISAASIGTTFGSVSVQFSSPPSLIPGSLYAIVVTSPNSTGSRNYKLGTLTGNPYADGRDWHRGSTLDPWGGNPSHDAQMDFCFAPCPSGGCTLTQGYWKNHPEAWPVTSVTLGSRTYSQSELLAIFSQPVQGNGLVSLAHQLIAAKLNIANGANGAALGTAIADADALIGAMLIPPIGTDSIATSATDALVTILDNFNKGVIGPGHCN